MVKTITTLLSNLHVLRVLADFRQFQQSMSAPVHKLWNELSSIVSGLALTTGKRVSLSPLSPTDPLQCRVCIVHLKTEFGCLSAADLSHTNGLQLVLRNPVSSICNRFVDTHDSFLSSLQSNAAFRARKGCIGRLAGSRKECAKIHSCMSGITSTMQLPSLEAGELFNGARWLSAGVCLHALCLLYSLVARLKFIPGLNGSVYFCKIKKDLQHLRLCSGNMKSCRCD